ncbi:hypothetical protein JXA84_10130, partial [candidate division WOR-3 bacterium]|nr:hypothetical protein [candidate division WOR-3 bacterium]
MKKKDKTGIERSCSFCNSRENIGNYLIQGKNAYICLNCVKNLYESIFKTPNKTIDFNSKSHSLPLPAEIK